MGRGAGGAGSFEWVGQSVGQLVGQSVNQAQAHRGSLTPLYHPQAPWRPRPAPPTHPTHPLHAPASRTSVLRAAWKATSPSSNLSPAASR